MKKKILQSIAVLFIILAGSFWGTQKVHAEGWENVGDAGNGGGVSSGIFSLAINPLTGEPYVAYRDSTWKASVIKFSGGEWQAVGKESLGNAAYCGWTHPSIVFNPATSEPYISFDDCSGFSVIKHGNNGWEKVGGAIWSRAVGPSLAFNPITNEPYVAYVISNEYNSTADNTTVAKLSNGGWQTVGNAGFSTNHVGSPSLAFNVSTGEPYVAYRTYKGVPYDNSDKPTIMKLVGETWQEVGNAEYNSSTWGISDPSIAVDSSTGEPYVEYAVYDDPPLSGIVKVMKYADGEWQNLSDSGHANLAPGSPSLVLNPVTNEPYVAYKDANSGMVVVKKFSEGAWQPVGNEGFSESQVMGYVPLAFHPNSNEPYVALYAGDGYSKLTVMKYVGDTPPPPTPEPTHKVAYIPIVFPDGSEYTHEVGDLKKRAKQVEDYYHEQSYGAVTMSSDFISDNWVQLDKKLTDPSFAGDEEEKWEKIRDYIIDDFAKKVDLNFDISKYDSVVVLVPESAWPSAEDTVKEDGLHEPGKKIIATENEPFSAFKVWAHELGHSLFKFGDYYVKDECSYKYSNGVINGWGMMGDGASLNPASPMMSFNKEEAGWLKYKNLQNGETQINLLSDLALGDEKVYRYEVANSSNSVNSYIFEGRNPEKEFQDEILQDDSVPLNYWLSKDQGVEMYAVTDVQNTLTKKNKLYNIPNYNINSFNGFNNNRVTLTPGDSYRDVPNEVQFTLTEENGGKMEINVDEYKSEDITSVVYLGNTFNIDDADCASKFPSSTENQPDIDLHVISQDGKKVGINYDTGEYEMRIDGAMTSRNIPGGGPEWISIPDNVNASYYLDTTPLKKWADETGANITDIKADFRVTTFDENGNRQDSEEMTVPIDLAKPTTPLAIKAIVDINPKTLNTKSNGNWITAFVELPKDYDTRQIMGESVILNNQMKADKIEFGDFDSDGTIEVMMKFDRTQVANILAASSTKKVTINGDFMHNGIPLPFEGESVFNVTNPGSNQKK